MVDYTYLSMYLAKLLDKCGENMYRSSKLLRAMIFSTAVCLEIGLWGRRWSVALGLKCKRAGIGKLEDPGAHSRPTSLKLHYHNSANL